MDPSFLGINAAVNRVDLVYTDITFFVKKHFLSIDYPIHLFTRTRKWAVSAPQRPN